MQSGEIRRETERRLCALGTSDLPLVWPQFVRDLDRGEVFWSTNYRVASADWTGDHLKPSVRTALLLGCRDPLTVLPDCVARVWSVIGRQDTTWPTWWSAINFDGDRVRPVSAPPGLAVLHRERADLIDRRRDRDELHGMRFCCACSSVASSRCRLGAPDIMRSGLSARLPASSIVRLPASSASRMSRSHAIVGLNVDVVGAPLLRRNKAAACPFARSVGQSPAARPMRSRCPVRRGSQRASDRNRSQDFSIVWNARVLLL